MKINSIGYVQPNFVQKQTRYYNSNNCADKASFGKKKVEEKNESKNPLTKISEKAKNVWSTIVKYTTYGKKYEYKKPPLEDWYVEKTPQITEPKFSFDYKLLEEDLSQTDCFDENWRAKNPKSANNILNAITQINAEEISDSKTATEMINSAIADKETFLQKAYELHNAEKNEYIDSIAQYTCSGNDWDTINQAILKIKQYGNQEDIEKINKYAWMYANLETRNNLVETTLELSQKSK